MAAIEKMSSNAELPPEAEGQSLKKSWPEVLSTKTRAEDFGLVLGGTAVRSG